MTYPIHDLYIRPIEITKTPEGSALTVLRYGEHLLRRFGLAEVVRLEAGQSRGPRVREVADEIWALIEGGVEFGWLDQRAASPTTGEGFRYACHEPTVVLAPFGVALEIVVLEGPARLLRLATHESDDA